ncbi:MAG: 30S ribosomal protein S18 [Candidatus Lambdaproteobacteria bacterium RIFOXYD2_FULL_50_16]|uniref:Small ribosomal subunit protein bS18 n=1 Tax=Candidatus Lambdaproteobacteria bacterium RIFOXYD2_FULL_50_16 TaxID=1817772 RepID=A0A1F6G9T0_9PROT|nr:MAG: 30S ribosomal protein S18 [Candidatus Lambdaproteobacteria bacterium RIFOXYD2_FULL_50_16]
MGKKKRNFGNREKTVKRPCPLLAAGVEHIDYKDVELLKQFITEKGKIIPRRITGLSATSQKNLTAAIKRARNAALLSFSEGYLHQDDHYESSERR